MPAERNHISDLSSFRYTPVNPVRSTKGNINLLVRDIKPQTQAQTQSKSKSNRNRDPIPNNTKIDYSECK